MNTDFIWWTGVVEDRDDPKQLGRCRIRILGYHSESKTDIPTKDLPWAYPAMPIDTRPRATPVGPVEGTWVMGFFKDGKSAQQPVMTHVLDSGFKTANEPDKGFNDPEENETGPKRTKWTPPRNLAGRVWNYFTSGISSVIDEDWPKPNENTINRLARGITKGTWHEWARQRRNTGIETAAPAGPFNYTWDEPIPEYNAQYPYNKVEESESGHVFEVDDTPNHERITRRHKKGSYETIENDGRAVKIVGSDYEIVIKDPESKDKLSGSKNVYVDGNVNITAGGDVNLMSTSGNVRIQSDKSIRLDADEYIVMKAGMGILSSSHYFSTTGPILHGGGSPMVVPFGFPTSFAFDFGQKYLKEEFSELLSKFPADSNVVKTITKYKTDLETARSGFENVQKKIQELKNSDNIESVQEQALDLKKEQDRITAELSKSYQVVSGVLDGSMDSDDSLALMHDKASSTSFIKEAKEVADGVSREISNTISEATGYIEEQVSEATGKVTSSVNTAIGEVSSIVTDTAAYGMIADSLETTKLVRDAMKKKMKELSKKLMSDVGTKLLTGTTIAFSMIPLIRMVQFGHAEEDLEDGEFRPPVDLDYTIVHAGSFVTGRDYFVNHLGNRDELDLWEKHHGLGKRPKVGQKFIANGPGRGVGSAALFYLKTDTSRRPSKGSIIEIAKGSIVDGAPLLNFEEMRMIDNKETLISIIELHVKPNGINESKYFQTWIHKENWDIIIGMIKKGDPQAQAVNMVMNWLRERAEIEQRRISYNMLENYVDFSNAGYNPEVISVLDKTDLINFSNRQRADSLENDILTREGLDRLEILEQRFALTDEDKERLIQVREGLVEDRHGRIRGTGKFTVVSSDVGAAQNHLSVSLGVLGTEPKEQRLSDLDYELSHTSWTPEMQDRKQKVMIEIDGLRAAIKREYEEKGKVYNENNTAGVSNVQSHESNTPIATGARKSTGGPGNLDSSNKAEEKKKPWEEV